MTTRRGYKRPTTTKPVVAKSPTYGINPIGKNSVNPVIRLANGGMAVAKPKAVVRPIKKGRGIGRGR